MKKKSPKTAPRGILKTGVLVEITDPAEQAELDRRCREAEKMLAEKESVAKKAGARKRK